MNIQRANKPTRSHKEREEPLDTIAEILITEVTIIVIFITHIIITRITFIEIYVIGILIIEITSILILITEITITEIPIAERQPRKQASE